MGLLGHTKWLLQLLRSGKAVMCAMRAAPLDVPGGGDRERGSGSRGHQGVEGPAGAAPGCSEISWGASTHVGFALRGSLVETVGVIPSSRSRIVERAKAGCISASEEPRDERQTQCVNMHTTIPSASSRYTAATDESGLLQLVLPSATGSRPPRLLSPPQPAGRV